MGYMRHHTIVVSSWNKESLVAAYQKACEIFPFVSPVLGPAMNNYHSFFVPPDGSKEGWQESDNADTARNEFVNWLDQQRYEDGSSNLDWVELFYGDDNRECSVVRHSRDKIHTHSTQTGV